MLEFLYQELFGRLRGECTNEYWFTSLAEARELIVAWRRDYNESCPHSALIHQTLAEFAASSRAGETSNKEEREKGKLLTGLYFLALNVGVRSVFRWRIQVRSATANGGLV